MLDGAADRLVVVDMGRTREEEVDVNADTDAVNMTNNTAMKAPRILLLLLQFMAIGKARYGTFIAESILVHM